MELSLTGIKMSIGLGRAASSLPIPYCGRRHRNLPDFARYVDGRHFQVASAVGEASSVSALGFDCLRKGLYVKARSLTTASAHSASPCVCRCWSSCSKHRQ